MQHLRELYLDHSECNRLDIGASVAMDVLVLELRRTWSNRIRKPIIRGRYPDDEGVRDILRATGIVKHLQVEGEMLDEPAKYHSLDLVAGHSTGPFQYKGLPDESEAFQSSRHEIATDQLTSYVDSCLNKVGFGLAQQGKKALSSIVGEILGNAQEHSGTPEWYVIGNMTQTAPDVGECNIAIVNFGRTFYETLRDESVDPQLRDDLKSLTRKHRGLFRRGWNEEALYTLYALQEGVSCTNRGYRDDDRGVGTVRIIEFFQDLGRSTEDFQPKMCIMSGSAHIMFDGTYRMSQVQRDDEMRSIIAFNKDNDIARKPDKDYVRSLKCHFPGTIISMRFRIDGKHLSTLAGETANERD